MTHDVGVFKLSIQTNEVQKKRIAEPIENKVLQVYTVEVDLIHVPLAQLARAFDS